MEFIIEQGIFHQAIQDVSRAVSSKTLSPILSGIKITADKDKIALLATNSDLTIEKVIPVCCQQSHRLQIIHSGSVVVSARYLGQVIKKLSGEIHIKGIALNKIKLISNGIEANMNGLDSIEFPPPPILDDSKDISMPFLDFKRMVKQTLFAVSKSDTRPVLTGVHLSLENGRFSCTATNSHRLAFSRGTVDSKETVSCVVPFAALNECSKVTDIDHGNMKLYITKQYIAFQFPSITLFSRLIEGNYPNVESLIPKEARTTLTLNKELLKQGIDRASLFASASDNNKILLEVIEGLQLKICSSSTEYGEIAEVQDIVSLNGESELTVTVDGNFMMDALKAIGEDEVQLSYSGSMKPLLLQAMDSGMQFHLISPVRTA
ncbi:DNA polymerase-3 subunit beta [Bacillus tianshenii]|uniref:Beta sliding clamp n=1 Tax=Sutcliffiella tianshenii TaxID=1463404 RepID=A0ABS2P319_9BACI|nr:DNA polymerase-3 subunit beta [Bacillus tianshenii]